MQLSESTSSENGSPCFNVSSEEISDDDVFLLAPAPFAMQFSESYCNRWWEVGPIRQWKAWGLLDFKSGCGLCTRKAKKQSKKASFRLVEQQRNRASWVHETWWNHRCGCLLSTTKRVHSVLLQKQPSLITRRCVILQHYNAKPHIAQRTRDTITRLNLEVLSHPSYSADLSPSDYHLFLTLLNSLDCKIFTSENHVKNAVSSFFEQ